MPAEKRFPAAYVAIRGIYAFDFVSHGIVENRIQIVEVPSFATLVHEAVEKVCSVEGRRKSHVFPKLYLYKTYHLFHLVCGELVGDFVQFSCFALELSEAHGFFGNMQTFVNSSFSESVLFDRAADDQVLQLLLVVFLARDPSFGRYDLS
jgi:hypothetical protein